MMNIPLVSKSIIVTNLNEEFDFEMTAKAVDGNGVRYEVTWIFSAIRGEEADNNDNYDFDNIYDVTPL